MERVAELKNHIFDVEVLQHRHLRCVSHMSLCLKIYVPLSKIGGYQQGVSRAISGMVAAVYTGL